MKRLGAYIVDKSCNLEETMKVIDANSAGFALVCDGRRLFGVVTDGDVRRYLLSGGALKESICHAANREPRAVLESERYLAEPLMRGEQLTVIPVVN